MARGENDKKLLADSYQLNRLPLAPALNHSGEDYGGDEDSEGDEEG